MNRSSVRRSAFRSALALALVAMASAPALAQADCRLVTGLGADAGVLSPPLDRPVTLLLPAGPLGDALAGLAAASGVRISYSSDFVGTDHPVCVSTREVPLGTVLADLIDRSRVDLRIAALDHVVIAPARRLARAPEDAEPTVESVIPVERVVVTGDPARLGTHDVVRAGDVLDSERLAAAGTDDLSRLLRASGPAIWSWLTPPSNLRARYAGVRGASSFGSTHPKAYIDGIEVADPLLLSRFTPEAIDRIEVVRGPQGGALYGAGAISGVVHIRTRSDPPGAASGSAGLALRSGAGVVGADHSYDRVVAQDHVLTGWVDRPDRSVVLNLATGRIGEYALGARRSYFSAIASGRSVGTDRGLSGIARLDWTVAGAGATLASGADPLSGPSGPSSAFLDSAADSRSVLQYTLGATLDDRSGDRFRNSVVFGIDGFRFGGPASIAGTLDPRLPGTGEIDRAGADLLTFRATSTWRAISGPTASASLAFGAEQTLRREVDAYVEPATAPGTDAVRRSIGWRRGTGLHVAADAVLDGTLFLDAGVRLQSDEPFGRGWKFVPLPTLGAAVRVGGPAVSATARTTYGASIRATGDALRHVVPAGHPVPTAALDLPPERQAGFESGVEVLVGGRFAFELTRFDQVATGLVRAVPSFESDPAGTNFRLDNAGEITNSGWEARSAASIGRLSLDATYASVDSRVRRLARGYAGDLRPGDRVLEVPRRTATLAATWSADAWSAALDASRAWDWIGYDALALRDRSADTSTSPSGSDLRAVWRRFDGSLRVDANAAFHVRPNVSLLLAAENLLDRRTGGPDQLSVLPGRTLSIGVRARL